MTERRQLHSRRLLNKQLKVTPPLGLHYLCYFNIDSPLNRSLFLPSEKKIEKETE
jgi:hypothetical protein